MEIGNNKFAVCFRFSIPGSERMAGVKEGREIIETLTFLFLDLFPLSFNMREVALKGKGPNICVMEFSLSKEALGRGQSGQVICSFIAWDASVTREPD